VIALKNVALEYRPDTWVAPQVNILHGVNVTFPTGSHVAILGGASSGKTTLLKILCGALPASNGIVYREGRVSFPVGIVGASGKVTVMQYIQFVAKCYCVEPKAFLRYVTDFAGLEDVLHRPTGKLDPDRRARLNMTIGYALPFEHYLFDARIAVGDPVFRKKCLSLFEARQRTSGIILATRRANLARQFCTSGAVLHAGSLTYFEDIDRAIDFYHEVEPNPAPRTSDVYYVPADAYSFDELYSEAD
jgi:capsular polysaccharide transport system ATP-binding protein